MDNQHQLYKISCRYGGMAASSGFDPQMFPSRIAIGYCISRNFCCDGSDMRTRCLHYKGYREFCHIVVDLVRLQSKPRTPTEKGKNSSSLQSRTFQATLNQRNQRSIKYRERVSLPRLVKAMSSIFEDSMVVEWRVSTDYKPNDPLKISLYLKATVK